MTASINGLKSDLEGIGDHLKNWILPEEFFYSIMV